MSEPLGDRSCEERLDAVLSSPEWRNGVRLWSLVTAVAPPDSTRFRAARGCLRLLSRIARSIRLASGDGNGRPERFRAQAPGTGSGDSTASRGFVPMRAAACGLRPGKVSVVLPVYNQAHFLGEAIAGVLGQQYRNLELVVVDDGSTDDIRAVLDRFVGDGRLKTIRQDNRGLPAALNAGFAACEGEFWTWTSADNIMEASQLARMVRFLSSNAEVGMTYGDYVAIEDDGRLIRDPSWRSQNRPDPDSCAIVLPDEATYLNLTPDNFIGPCFLYRGWMGRILGGYSEPMGIEDFDYWMRMNVHWTIRHVDTRESLYRYRVHPASLSARGGALGIHGLTVRRVEADRVRRAYLSAPGATLADPAAAAWCEAQRRVAVTFASPQELMHAFLVRDKATVVVSDSWAEDHAEFLDSWRKPIAILMAAGAEHLPELHAMLGRANVVFVVPDVATASAIREAASGPATMVDGLSSQAMDAIEAHAGDWALRECGHV